VHANGSVARRTEVPDPPVFAVFAAGCEDEPTMKPSGVKAETYLELVELPEDLTGQIIDGTLVVEPTPPSEHQFASNALHLILGSYFQLGSVPGGWRLHTGLEVHLGPDVLQPDLAGWRLDLLPKAPRPDERYLTIAPSWVGEVLSPSTGAVDRSRKMTIYAREDVDHIWLVDAGYRTLEAYRRDGRRWMLIDCFAGDDSVRAEPFEALEFQLGGLWEP
jgi:Uma2 family endonuclease